MFGTTMALRSTILKSKAFLTGLFNAVSAQFSALKEHNTIFTRSRLPTPVQGPNNIHGAG